MRKFLFFTLFFLLVGCSQPSKNSQNPAIKTIAEPLQPIHLKSDPIHVGTITAAKSYGCYQTGISLGFIEAHNFQCDLEHQTATFTLSNQSQLETIFYADPKNLLVGDKAAVYLEANLYTGTPGTKEEATCVLTDNKTNKTVKERSFQVNSDLSLTANCLFEDGTGVTLSYTIHPIPSVCIPKVVWSSEIPDNFTMNDPGEYVVELAFPKNQTIDARFINNLGWTPIQIKNNHTLNFTDSTGTVYFFDPACPADGQLAWETRNLISETRTFEVLLHTKVVTLAAP